jgi:adenosylcobinamide-GDP ribazoletransferase
MNAAFGFLTVLPFRGVPNRWTLANFPVVGAVLGALIYLLGRAVTGVGTVSLAAMVMVVADLGLTGLLHFDGLADAADGLLPHLELARRREVMRSPEVGAYGVTVVAATLLARYVGIVQLVSAGHGAVIIPIWCGSRLLMAVSLRWGRSASPTGIGQYFGDRALPAWLACSFGVAIPVVALLVGGITGGVSVGALLGGFGVTVWLAYRRLEGLTGDVLGAAGVVGETLGLLIGGLRW